jgi:pyruvate/2-oxoglutarate dehydrogenase complex dihydrolipoamide acyltransferase (E2) component
VVGALAGAVVVDVLGAVVLVAGAPLAGAVAVGVLVVVAGVVVVPVGAVLVVVVCVGASDAGVVDVPDGGADPLDGSAAKAPPTSGPPSPAAVNPPPASAETNARRTQKRAPFTPDMLGPCSSLFGPVVAVEQSAAPGGRPLDPIHIGREPHLGKGFVIVTVSRG